jgi:hypothetical protein
MVRRAADLCHDRVELAFDLVKTIQNIRLALRKRQFFALLHRLEQPFCRAADNLTVLFRVRMARQVQP